jgi:hypothetical protein
MRPYLKKKTKNLHTHTKRAGGVVQGEGPEFKSQCHQKKKKKKK